MHTSSLRRSTAQVNLYLSYSFYPLIPSNTKPIKTMSNASFNAGQSLGQSQTRADQSADLAKQSAGSAQNSASAAMDHVSAAADSSGSQAQQHKEEAAGFLQQTGEQVKNMAQGAVDSVKHTLGMDKQN